MSDAGKNRRERAAAAQQAANTAEKKRERMVRIVGAVTVLVVVVAIIGVAVVARNSASSSTDAVGADITAAADPSAPLPTGVQTGTDPYPYGVPYGTASDVPVLEIWEDFQCPACQALEAANGAGIEGLAAEGKIKLVWRPTTFLDRNLGNDSSRRALAAWGCAIDQGKTLEYHTAVFSNPPATEGDGFTDAQLIDFASQAGITGAELEAFTTCVNDKTYIPWAANTTKEFLDNNIQGTPYGLLNGVEVPTATLASQPALEKLIADTVAGGSAAPSASPAAS